MELIELHEEFSTSKKFIEGSYFVEQVAKGPERDEAHCREIYLSWRKRFGRSRALSTTHWHNFLQRLGVDRFLSGYLAGTTALSAHRMPLSHFLKMERVLLENSSLSPRVRNLVMKAVNNQQAHLEDIRDCRATLPEGAVSKLPVRVIDSVRKSMASDNSPISSHKITGLMTVIADMSVLFTTRDWGVTGTLSTMAGGLAATMTD